MKKKIFGNRNEIILIIIILLISIGSFFVYKGIFRAPGAYVEVMVDDEEYGRYSLNDDCNVSIETKYGRNELMIKDGMADMTDADCRDKICVSHKAISKNGETIICLPHKVVVRIVSDQSDTLDGISY